MDADFSIELGREDPVLDLPWKDPAGRIEYRDLKRHPELLASIEEAQKFPELAEFLSAINSPQSLVETAKCDAWATAELGAGEEIYDASHKFTGYVDAVLSDQDAALSFSANEQFARSLVELLQQAPELPAAAEVLVRRCYFAEDSGVREGFYSTLYMSGYGTSEAGARQNWGAGLSLLERAILQWSAGEAR